MDPSHSLRAARLLTQLRDGDNEAAREIFARYAQRLARVAEQHLNHKLRGRVDSEDIVQSVLQTFFKRSARGEFQIDNSAQIWQLLVRITLMRVRAKARHHTAEVRDVRAEGATVDLEPADGIGHEPDPAEAILMVEAIEQLVGGLPPLYCQVLDLRLQGHSAAEIAGQLKVSRRTIYRALELLQERLTSQERDADASGPES
jgi:RNA polymerase sigma-70 factor (ECF subfamily)